MGGGSNFAGTEGIIPAPENPHAVRATVDKALKGKETGEENVSSVP